MNKIFPKIKNIALAFSMGVMALASASCSSDDPFITADENDYPRILNSEFSTEQPDGIFTFANITRDQKFNLNIVVTPAEYTTVNWYFDGVKSYEGKNIDTLLLAGTYNVKVEAVTTKGLSTYRNGTVTVNPLNTDPVISNEASARLLVGNKQAVLSGNNLSAVKKISINGMEADVTSTDASSITFTTPDVADGEYRFVLIDADGNKYGAGWVTVSSKPYVMQTAVTAKSQGEVTFTGINLDKVSKVTAGGAAATVKSAEYDKLVVTLPELVAGSYEITASATDGSEVTFSGNNSCALTITKETTLWEGTAVMNWDAAILSITPEQMADVPVGSKINIYYEVPEAEYHNLRIITKWWNDVPGGAQIDITASTPNPFILDYSQEFKDKITTEEGWSCVGFGYTVTKITYE